MFVENRLVISCAEYVEYETRRGTNIDGLGCLHGLARVSMLGARIRYQRMECHLTVEANRKKVNC